MYFRYYILHLICILAVFSSVACKNPLRMVAIDRIETYGNQRYGQFNFTSRRDKNGSYATLIIEFYQDWAGDGLDVDINIYKWSDNQYKLTAVSFHKPLCDYIQHEMKMLFAMDNKNLFKNYLKACPFKKGKYWVKDFPLSLFPASMFPLWKVKVFFELTYKKTITFLNTTIYAQVKDFY